MASTLCSVRILLVPGYTDSEFFPISPRAVIRDTPFGSPGCHCAGLLESLSPPLLPSPTRASCLQSLFFVHDARAKIADQVDPNGPMDATGRRAGDAVSDRRPVSTRQARHVPRSQAAFSCCAHCPASDGRPRLLHPLSRAPTARRGGRGCSGIHPGLGEMFWKCSIQVWAGERNDTEKCGVEVC